MSKKVISILLSAAMLVAMFCIGFGAISASADDTVTYYFLAPDNYFKTEAGALNSSVGYYYWENGGNGDWPGQEATPAPDVHPNAFKIEIADNDAIGTIIFNAFVDAGNPADPEKAAVAHQTININVEDDEFYGQIYVLDNNSKDVNEFSGAITTGGDWFTLDTFKDSANYKTYGFADDKEETVETKTEPTPGKTTYHKDDIVTVTYTIKDIDAIGSLNAEIAYNADILELYNSFTDKRGNAVWYEKNPEADVTLVVNGGEAGSVILGLTTSDPEYGSDSFKGSTPVTLVTVTFKATKDFNVEDLGIDATTTKLVEIKDGATNEITSDAAAHTAITTEVTCEHTVDTDTATDTDTSSEVKASDTDSETKESGDTPDSEKDSEKKGSDSKSGTSSSSTTTTTTPTVQTAGTFAVISLVVILMAAAGVVIHTRKKTEE